MKNQNYDLSYPVETVDWNGMEITRLPDENFLPALKVLKLLGINEIMISGYGAHKPSAFNVTTETKRVGGHLAFHVY